MGKKKKEEEKKTHTTSVRPYYGIPALFWEEEKANPLSQQQQKKG